MTALSEYSLTELHGNGSPAPWTLDQWGNVLDAHGERVVGLHDISGWNAELIVAARNVLAKQLGETRP